MATLTSLYAPQARLVDLATGTIIGATHARADSSAAIAPDIISAKVTLTNTGVGQLQVTLNNQRFQNPSFGDSATPWPPWKYNDFSPGRRGAPTDGLGAISFGQLVRVDFRYGDGSWIKMILAQVNDLQYTFPATGGAQVIVVGEDLLCRLKVKPRDDVNHDRKQEEQIVQAVLDAVFTDASAKPGLALLGGAADQEGRTQAMRTLRHTKTTTYFQFVSDLAERLNYELFADFKDVRVAPATGASLGPITVSSELDIAFQPARSGYPPQGDKQSGLDASADAAAPLVVHYELRRGLNLLELSPRFKMFDMPTTAEAFGTNHGARGRSRQQLTPGELEALLVAELPRSSNYDVAMQHAIAARQLYFGDAGAGADSSESSASTNLDAPRLKLKAGAQFLKKVREFVTAEGQVIGLPRLRPGQHLDIVGLRPPFDGYHYVTKTVHTLDATGYKTQFTLRRPGMLPPERYLSATPPAQITGSPPAAGGGAP